MADQESITGVAVLLNSGEMLSLLAPYRHSNLMAASHIADGGPTPPNRQGFITSQGRWKNRKKALLIAQAAGQILMTKTRPYDELFSEDMW
jgi:hypothetical protein